MEYPVISQQIFSVLRSVWAHRNAHSFQNFSHCWTFKWQSNNTNARETDTEKLSHWIKRSQDFHKNNINTLIENSPQIRISGMNFSSLYFTSSPPLHKSITLLSPFFQQPVLNSCSPPPNLPQCSCRIPQQGWCPYAFLLIFYNQDTDTDINIDIDICISSLIWLWSLVWPYDMLWPMKCEQNWCVISGRKF